MNICLPDKSSELYARFGELINLKVNSMMTWLEERDIEYVWNNWIDGHLYRLYIPSKDLLLDFEFYPVNNLNYNYIRINYNTDVIKVLERLFPENIVDTQELNLWKLNQKATNKFLRENGASPIYDKSAMRVALVGENNTIYQCAILRRNQIIANVIKQKCAVPYGTYIILRYLNEMFGFDEILIKVDLDNSFTTSMYQLLNLQVINKTAKKKIWWSPDKTKWHIDKENPENYIPFYFSEQITYKYPIKKLNVAIPDTNKSINIILTNIPYPPFLVFQHLSCLYITYLILVHVQCS